MFEMTDERERINEIALACASTPEMRKSVREIDRRNRRIKEIRMSRNDILTGDAVEVLSAFPEETFDLTVTSPPYDDLRTYNGYRFDARSMIESIFRVTKTGGICVWVVGDKIVNGDRTLSHFDHAIIGKEVGFRCHDVMIYQKKQTPFMRSNGYTPAFELMIVFSKGKPKTFNPIKCPTLTNDTGRIVKNRNKDGSFRDPVMVKLNKEKVKTNVWDYGIGLGGSTSDKIAFDHPAIFPERLAEDHILSWSNPGDFVLDPMTGSGTTCKMARKNGRDYLGIDISSEYVDLAKRRVGIPVQSEMVA